MSLTFAPATPVLAVCGWSGAGKTTLVETLLPRFKDAGLQVGVWKHDAHRLEIDKQGKDTDRFYRAGAGVVIGEDAEQTFLRARKGGGGDNFHRLRSEPLDLLLVEGHKSSPFPKIWLEGGDGSEPRPSHLEHCLHRFPRSETIEDEVYAFIHAFLVEEWRRKRIRTAILIGGESKRMGRPKALLEIEGLALLERLVRELGGEEGADMVLSGTGPVPEGLRIRLPILPDAEGGGSPLAGILSLLRWDPDSAWVVVGCDLPEMNREYVEWLISDRAPGKWVIAPRLSGQSRREPLAALYEPQMAPTLEAAWRRGERSLQAVLNRPQVDSPEIPSGFTPCLRNINTPEDWEKYLSGSKTAQINVGE